MVSDDDTSVHAAYTRAMILGAHFLLYSKDPDADRTFFRDVLEFRTVDAGHGWQIFGLPPSELAVHPAESNFVQRHADRDLMGAVLYLMCDDLQSTVKTLAAKQVDCAPIQEAPWGSFTIIGLPSGGSLGLYQPAHATAID